tara:strand:- start:865 stop:1143 length:279 start_codon:yes stop_codon:yes gene_type:complete
MLGFIKSVFRPVGMIGNKLVNRIGSIGSKLARGFKAVYAGEPIGNIGRVGRESVIRAGRESKFVNLPVFEKSGNKRLLRGSDYMSNNAFIGY